MTDLLALVHRWFTAGSPLVRRWFAASSPPLAHCLFPIRSYAAAASVHAIDGRHLRLARHVVC
jgi:hypothetical protein